MAAEVQIHRKVKHPNVVQLYDIYETPQKIFLIMELYVRCFGVWSSSVGGARVG